MVVAKSNKQKEIALWLELKSEWGRVLIGACLLILAFVIITNNEQEAIQNTKSLSTLFQNLRVVTDINKVESINEGSLVYLAGELHVDEPLTEPDYGISVPAVCLKRRVQMFQWIEYEESPKKYTYQTDWRDKLIDSSNFHMPVGHQNPSKFPLTSKLYISEVVRIGTYVFSVNIKKKFADFMLITSDERPENRDIKLHAGLYYHTSDVWNPEVGNIRVQFSFAGMSGDMVSIIARQSGKMLGQDGIILLSKGKVLPDAMIKDEHNRNVWSVRFYRSLGWLFLYISSPFFAVFTRYTASRYKTVYNFLILDGLLSANIVYASIVFTIIISQIWYLYDRSIGLCIILAFQLPWLIYAIYKKCKLLLKKTRNQ
ncbi:transmembrane protein 43 homolog [Cimex lectularius]|uniref:Transmembrane protein 43 homolog n=1 Tax=Cimex lectularius TaxID=79782 RepID=A0A8I6SLI8_CIMLE|nr:transmembrane protein 43 homolog [Cimex lectularius]